MREILFKAKQKEWDEWVEGDLIHEPFGTCIQVIKDGCRSKYKIDPETICQYTGLTDKNGKKIWENDICIIHSSYIDEEDGFFTVEWDGNGARFALYGDGLTVDFDNYYGYECEVIGNIFDTPELLGGNSVDTN